VTDTNFKLLYYTTNTTKLLIENRAKTKNSGSKFKKEYKPPSRRSRIRGEEE
jgi:hypothetical protein